MNNTYISLTKLQSVSFEPYTPIARAFLLSAAAVLTVQHSIPSNTFAGSATWLASPATGDWNTATNWTAGGPAQWVGGHRNVCHLQHNTAHLPLSQ